MAGEEETTVTEHQRNPVGTIVGFDLTVPDAEAVRDFYAAVIGWTATPFDMGGYADYFMQPPGSDEPAAGIVHARGQNANLPPYWLAYIAVADLDASIQACESLGGALISGPSAPAGEANRYCVIRDPAGAYLALLEQ
jgi:predicted enzyme related to lactoylglutathione lyase